jgi:hypothetical protein
MAQGGGHAPQNFRIASTSPPTLRRVAPELAERQCSVPRLCRNPTLAKCGGEAQHLKKLEVGSLPGLPNVQSSTERAKTPRIGVFLVSLERS